MSFAGFSAVPAPFQRRMPPWRHNDRNGGHDRSSRTLMWEDEQIRARKTAGIAIARGPRGSRRLWPLAALAAAGAVLPGTVGVASAGVHDSTYRQVNLRSDIPGLAAVTATGPGALWEFPPLRAPTRHRAERCGSRSRQGQDHPVHLGNRHGRQQGWPDRHDHLWRADRPGVQQRLGNPGPTSLCMTRPANWVRRPSFSPRKRRDQRPNPGVGMAQALTRRPR